MEEGVRWMFIFICSIIELQKKVIDAAGVKARLLQAALLDACVHSLIIRVEISKFQANQLIFIRMLLAKKCCEDLCSV